MPSNYAATMQGDGAAAPSKYLGLMQAEASDDRARFGAAASQAIGVNPDEVAKARKTAEFLGVHPGVVEAAPQDSMRAATLKKLDTDTAAAPVLRQRYTDADFAKLASDDSGVLSGLESVVRRMMNGGTQRLPQTQPSVMSGVEFGNAVRRQIELNPALDADTARALVGQGVTIDNGPLMGPSRGPAPSVRSVLGGIFNVERLRATSAGMSVAAADLLGLDNSGPLKRYERATSRAQAADPAFETSTGQGIYSGAVSTVQNAPGLALSVLTGNPLPGLAVAFGQVGGEAYGKYRARGATAGQAGAGALLDGGIEVATELLPMRFMVDRLGKAGATEFVKGLLAREVPTEQLATLAQDAVDTAIANPDKTWAQYIAERPDAAYQTLLATIVQGGAMGAVNTVAGKLAPERRAADQAERAAAYMAEVARLMEASKLRARDPGTFNAYMQALADDGQVPAELYVDAQQLANTLNQSAISIEQLRAFAPTMAAQLEAASFVPGADVRVPVAELAAAGPEITTPLIDHLRASETAMSRVEAQEYLTAEGDSIRAQVETLLAEQQDAATFRQQVADTTAQFQQQLDAVGKFRPEVNKAYAGLLGNFYAVQALRAGVPLPEFLDRYQLRVTGTDVKGGQRLEQAAPDTPEFKAWFGDSKVVDSDGKPLVVYHGTNGDITAFDASKVKGRFPNSEGFYFTSMPLHASVYADSINNAAEDFNPNSRFIKPAAEGGNVMPAYVSLQNPKILTVSAWGTLESRVDGDGGAQVRAAREAGHDGVIVKREAGDEWDGMLVIAFRPEQIKSATGNRGTFDPNDPNILNQDARGALSFGQDITASPSVIALLQGADLSTFIHESGHFFLEVQADLAAKIQTQISSGESVSDAERGMVDDFNRILTWFGVTADAQSSALDRWVMMPLEEKRPYHEQWARGFERYAMEGKAPSLELQTLFAQFRAWLVRVYKTLTNLDVKLTDDVRAVMDRMLASDTAIADAQAARAMGPLFQTPEQAGMTPDEFAAYQALAERATASASAELDARLMRDMRWLSRARDRALKAAQAEAADKRAEVEREVRAQVMAEPIYRAWAFLTGKAERVDRGPDIKPTGEEVDNLFTAIAKLGGLDRAEVKKQWGIDAKEKLDSGVFGSPVVRKDGGLSIDAMAERLVEAGYLLPDENGKADLAKFEALFDDQRRGIDRYSIRKNYADAAGEMPVEALDLPAVASGRLRSSMVKAMNPQAYDRLSKLRMTSEERGIDPDIVAETFGFPSGQQLVETLLITPPPAAVIDELTDFEMLQRYGDIASKEALDRAADDAVHNELRARVIANEMKALAKANKVTESGDSLVKQRDTVNVMARAAQDYAAQVIARQQIKNLRPKQYAAAEARSAKLAGQAIGKDLAEAAVHKRNQLVNNYATKAAYGAQDEVRKGVEFFRKVLRGDRDTIIKTRDWDVVQAARAVLAEYGLGTKGEAAQSYLKAVAENDPGMFNVLRDKIDALTVNARPLNQLTVEEFRGLLEEIQGLWFLAKRSRQVEIDGQLIDIEAAKLPLVQRMEAIGVPDRVPGEGMAVTDAERRVARIRTAWAALRRVESWTGAKDGADMGPFRKYIWQPVKEAADRYRTDRARYLKQYRDLLAGLDVGRARIDAPELGYTFGYSRGGSGKAEILHALLHTGNTSNKRKLLLGRGWATENEQGVLDTSRWDAFLQRMIDQGVLTKADYDFAQGVWDMLESMKPLAQKAHRDVFGRYFDEVTADPFTTPFGEYRGGYVPAMMDPEVVKDAATRKLQEDESQTLAYAFPATNRGFTKTRVENNKPLLLDLRTLSQHIDKVLLFSHLEQPVREVRKVLGSKAVSTPLHRLDPAAFDSLLTPWLNRAARQSVETPVPGDNGLMRFFSLARSRAGMAAMFANVVNTAQQVTGLSVAAVKVRPRYLVGAMADYVKAPRQFVRAVADVSPYMATRMDNEVAQMNDAINDILLNPSVYDKAQAWTAKHAYFMQSAVDNVIGPVVWTGAYNQALEAGQTEQDARRIADAAVRETQGSTLPEDVSRFETGNAFVRLFTQFAGYFNMQANLLGTEFAKAQHDLGLRKGMGRGLYVFTLGFLAPAMVSELIVQAFRGGPGDEDKDGETLDDWLMAVLVMGNVRAALGMVPVAGPTINAGMNAFNDKPYDDRISTSPAVSMVESAVRSPASVYNAVVEDGSARKAVRDVATLISLTTGLPANAIARPAGYLAGMAEDRIEPTSVPDAARGLVTGTPSPDSKR